MLANILQDRISGDDILSLPLENTFGHGIQSLSISGNGQLISFYAGGMVQELEARNLSMPPYEATYAACISRGDHLDRNSDRSHEVHSAAREA
jgi:hypothetical protein